MFRWSILVAPLAFAGIAAAQVEGRVDEATCARYQAYAEGAANGFAGMRGAERPAGPGLSGYDSTEPLMEHHRCVIRDEEQSGVSEAMCVVAASGDSRRLLELVILGEEVLVSRCLPELERLEEFPRTEMGERFVFVSPQGADEPIHVVVGISQSEIVVDDEPVAAAALTVRFGQRFVRRPRRDRIPFSALNLHMPFPLNLLPWGAPAPPAVVAFFEGDGSD